MKGISNVKAARDMLLYKDSINIKEWLEAFPIDSENSPKPSEPSISLHKSSRRKFTRRNQSIQAAEKKDLI